MDEGGVAQMRLRFVLSWIVAPLLVIGAALTGGYLVSNSAGDARAPLASALDTLPADSQVAGFTDWSAIRQHLDLGRATTAADRAALNDDASLLDLSTRSVIGRSIEEMHDSYGWSAADLDWEVYGQAGDGAAMVARFDDSISLSDVRGVLRKLGYQQDGRVWNATASSPIDGELSATLASVAIVPGQRLVVAADRETYVRTVLQVIDGDEPSLLSVRPASEVAQALVGTDSAFLQSSGVACAATSVEKQSADVLAQARAAVARAGELADVTFAGRGLTSDSADKQQIRFAMGFDSPSDAASQLKTRKTLARGTLIGGNGRIEDSLQLTGARVNGSTATLRFDHDPDSAAYMAGVGPLLFASCPA
jgi:hypothetical protein